MEGPRPKWKEQIGGRVVGNEQIDERMRKLGRMEETAEAARFQREHPELVEKTERLLAAIDFNELQNIFTEYTTHSGIEKEVVSIPTRENVFILGQGVDQTLMAYAPYAHFIRIYALTLEKTAQAHEMSEAEQRTAFLKWFIHECTHGASKNVSLIIEGEESHTFIHNSGLHEEGTRVYKSEDGAEARDVTDSFLMLNEGITERIADEVFHEYIKRKPYPGISSETAMKITTSREQGENTYDYARRFVGIFVDTIARETDVPEDVVWKGLVRQYYRGDSLLEKETRELLDDMLGPAFTGMLAVSKSPSYLKLMREYHPKLELKDAEAARKWLQHLEIARGAK